MQPEPGRPAVSLGPQILFSRTTSAVDTLPPRALDSSLRILLVLGQEAVGRGGVSAATLQLAQEAAVLKHLLEQSASRIGSSPSAVPCQVSTLVEPDTKTLVSTLEQGQFNVFFYAGHGVPAPDGGLLFLSPEMTLSGMELLEQFRAKVGRLVLVVDEYGVVQGLLTPHDLLEAITGELQPGAKSDAWATQREDGSWLLEGLMPINELKTRLGIEVLPLEDRGRYNTLAGLLMAVSGRLPVTTERIHCADWRFEVLDLDGKRIDKVLASPAKSPPP
jgi:hypothetical protein